MSDRVSDGYDVCQSLAEAVALQPLPERGTGFGHQQAR